MPELDVSLTAQGSANVDRGRFRMDTQSIRRFTNHVVLNIKIFLYMSRGFAAKGGEETNRV